MTRVRALLVAVALLWAGSAGTAGADVVLLLAEPYGRGAGFNPTGHVSLYLTRVCAETPTRLRRCRDDEAGVVLSRYNRLGNFDWAAVPVLGYLYGVAHAEDVPASTTPASARALRDAYRRAHLRALFPDERAERDRRWMQMVGAAHDRQFVAISVATAPEQDDELIAAFNGAENRPRFNVLFRNCADFARDVINTYYYPRALRSNVIADLGVTTPKQVARSLVRHGRRHPETALSVFLIPQIPGNRKPSPRTRGVLESLLRVKKYSVPLAAVQPWVPVGIAAGYLVSGRFNPHRLATHTAGPEDFAPRLP